MSKFLRVKNYDTFQHYNDRTPPWIKLYNSLLENYEFSQLTDAARGHLLCIWLLASRTKNQIPNDERWVSVKIQAKKKVNLKELVRLGFLEEITVPSKINDLDSNLASTMQAESSNMLATCKQNACLEENREEEKRREESRGEENARELASVPEKKLVENFNRTCCPPLLPVSRLTIHRQLQLQLRWDEHPSFEFWDGFFSRIAASDFLCGRAPPGRGNDRAFLANFEWCLVQDNFVKIVEGRYDNPKGEPSGTEYNPAF